jgi:hypothetical protein
MAGFLRPKKSDDWKNNQWPCSIPTPEAREGGMSTWEIWDQESRRLDLAFAPTQPSEPANLLPETGDEPPPPPLMSLERLTVDDVLHAARHHNRVCPQPEAWAALYRRLGGERFADLRQPPVQPWTWSKLSALQKRVRFREHIEWADSHDRLKQIARFIDGMPESDWLHMAADPEPD